METETQSELKAEVLNFMISISLETLKDKSIRVTGRIDGRTVEYFEGSPADAKQLVIRALNATAPAHKLPSGEFDMKHIELNEAAKTALATPAEKCALLLKRVFPHINPKLGYDTPHGFRFLLPECRKALEDWQQSAIP